MPHTFTVAIFDKDPFFVHGLTALLQSFILCHHDSLRVVNADRVAGADLVFRNCFATTPACCTAGKTILIHEAGPVRRGPVMDCPRIQGVISRRTTPAHMLQEVARVLSLPTADADRAALPCLACTQSLNWRERQILSELATGARASQVARRLGLSSKTVSGYKCRAMHKLGFSRSIELYRWLLSGGLEREEEPPV
ncbi:MULTISPECIES: helix-turn-helix transcriptional regulator [Serratia]|uniref:helix-turn-helix transcriptional regulator n=1 Tax=Serratia TaxID=613 RepID=UPI0023619241|nr:MULTISPECIES: helix-turn-helix transcriptional regulator [Serratia]